ncbi:unnamed protein product [Tetraodon nigroviridis]|uniref:(spotted green pufferfish) hypothetical protein n=1 Tax=Tetraodon nigroviridis TaxID=99883 RepID=Q4SHC1_TETNG|nr:unnamed protein product [Tetraodon nigroviridis]
MSCTNQLGRSVQWQRRPSPSSAEDTLGAQGPSDSTLTLTLTLTLPQIIFGVCGRLLRCCHPAGLTGVSALQAAELMLLDHGTEAICNSTQGLENKLQMIKCVS